LTVLTSHYYESEDDLRQMQDLLMAARAATDDWRYPPIGVATFRFFMVACHLNPYEFVRLWHDRQGRLVAYALLGEDPAFDCEVAPEYDGAGLEAEALDWAETQLVALRQRDPSQWGEPLVTGVRQDDTERIAFLEGHGFRYRGKFTEVNMLRALAEPIPPAVLPAGCQVRPLADDAAEIADRMAAYREVWLPWTDGNISAEDYARFMRLPCYDRTLDIITVAPDGAVAALVTGWADPINRIGELDAVSARPAYRRQGFMRAALLECLRRLQTAGMNRVCVSTGETNTPARQLYESVGFRVVNRYLDYVKPADHRADLRRSS
jgi:ribosomal protein S18 acetylase RimI-like enzyme